MEAQPRQIAPARILVVDDSPSARLLIASHLRAAGLSELVFAASAREAFHQLGMDGGEWPQPFDLILIDLLMPEIDGIEASRKIKADPRFLDVPLIMVTAEDSMESLKDAFEAGAIDYVRKPVNSVELLARVKSALRLKQETDCRKSRERELLELTEKLKRLSSVDGLTGIANRRSFDEELERLWRRAQRDSAPISLILIDVDHFKKYNDTHGHLAGDECLRQVAQVLSQATGRPFDMAARYGGEEFAVILPDTDKEGAGHVAEILRCAVEALAIPHGASAEIPHVTISAGAGTMAAQPGFAPDTLIALADRCLYEAKRSGRNRFISAAEELSVV